MWFIHFSIFKINLNFFELALPDATHWLGNAGLQG